MEKVKEMKFKVRQWLTRKDFTDNPMPMRVMFGHIERETSKAYLINVYGKPEPTGVCMRCGRKLDHPVSVLYGIGPECGGHWHINPFKSEEELNAVMEEIKQKLKDTTWSGWVPKSGVEELEETGQEIVLEPKPETNPEEKKETENKPAAQPKADDKPVKRYKLEITDALVNDLFKELEKTL